MRDRVPQWGHSTPGRRREHEAEQDQARLLAGGGAGEPIVHRRRSRYVYGTFWALVTVALVITGLAVDHWALLTAVATGPYSAYLYRGGRYRFFFF